MITIPRLDKVLLSFFGWVTMELTIIMPNRWYALEVKSEF